MSHYRQTAVSPELSLTAKAKGSIDRGYQLGYRDLAQGGNLLQNLFRFLFATFPQHLQAGAGYPLRQLLVELAGPLSNATLAQLCQPLCPLLVVIDLTALITNAAPAKNRLQPILYPRVVLY